MSVKALQDYTFVSKYARYKSEMNRRETWNEAVVRVEEMHLRKYPQIKKEIKWAFEQVKAKRVLGSQRALQFGGKPVEKKNARIYNCIASYCDRQRFFQECFWLLLCGCGTGFSVQKHHAAKLSDFSSIWIDQIRDKVGVGQSEEDIEKDGNQLAENLVESVGRRKVYAIPDSIEGWADSLGVLMSSFLGGGDFPEYEGYWVEFDYSLIRPEGAALGSSSGKAPGPKPLKNAIEKIRALILRCLMSGQNRLRTIDAYDIVMHASDAVLSGGVRRSATICLFSPDDLDMAQAKTGNWFQENPQRGRSNNSALLVRDQTSKEDFEQLMSYVREFGEPGFVWSDSTELLVNPCVEIGLYPVDITTGLSGWEACNLCEINGRYCKTPEDFEMASKAAAIIGTCQAGYTDLKYLGQTSKNILEREALLGVSITGMMDNPEVLFDPVLQRKNAKLILRTNAKIAAKIGINPTARATCVKPAGTTSCILGTASGIHAHHAKRYIRRSQANYLEPPMQHFKKANPLAVEPSVWSANGTDEVLAFCIEVPKGAKTNNDIDALKLLEYVKLTQKNWVMSGTNKEHCVHDWLVHNVSNTISVKPDEWESVTDFIYNNRQWFAGISLLPITGDKDYPQAPFTAIYTPTELVRMYGDASVMASGLIVDGLHAFGNNLWKACDAALDQGEPLVSPEHPNGDVIKLDAAKKYDADLVAYENKMDWKRRSLQFADRYFDGDIRLMTYCLKDVNNWKYWCDLKREYKDVDYTEMIEEQDNTKNVQEWACSGGSCDLTYV
jgi:ribonucleoside-diphosphate reductase alpha chain